MKVAFDRNRPHNDLPPLPPKVELETKAVLKKAIAARTALAELKGAGDLIPNQSVLINSIGLQEARLSSEIENIVTTSDQLYIGFADQGRSTDPQTKEVLSYHAALSHGFAAVQAGRGLSTRLFEEIVAVIKKSNIGVRRVPGTKLAGPSNDIIYTPPEGESRLRTLLADLERFIYMEDDLDPLVKMALMHYQFEAIHPFTDGNGRTGRILNILFLIERKLLDTPVLYLSRYILERRNDYYRGLRLVTEEGRWEEWLLYVLSAIEDTALATRAKVDAIRKLMTDWTERVKRERPAIYSKDLMEIVFRYPYCKIGFLEEAGVATRQTSSKYLKELSEMGLFHPIKRGREIYFVNDAFFNVLTE